MEFRLLIILRFISFKKDLKYFLLELSFYFFDEFMFF
jgi:hypothetical protein